MINAKSLIYKFLELKAFSPCSEWTEEQFADNPPRLFRLRQLMAMFRAFGLPWEPSEFMWGKFIDPEDVRYNSLISKLIKEEMEEASERTHGRKPAYEAMKFEEAAHNLPTFFYILFSYRMCLESPLEFSKKFIEINRFGVLAVCKLEKVNGAINSNIAIIDDLLAEFVSPEGASFPVEKLVRDYGYPI